jgi:hypothetical protein
MTGFYKKILYIQNTFRQHLHAFKNRSDILGEVWEREKGMLIKDCILKKTKKK